MQALLQLPGGNALRRPHAAIAARPVAVALCKNLHNGVWNFGSPAPLYAAQVLVLRSLSCLRAVTETLERFSSLPLFFVSGRFATFFFLPTPGTGGRP
jgi:hypothetical protein